MQYSILIQYDATDGIYVASIPELKGCMAHGYTREAAMDEIQIALQLQLEIMQEKGMIVPSPMMHVS